MKLLFLIILGKIVGANSIEDKHYWASLAKEDLMKVISNKPNTGLAKNIILFIGDGLDLTGTTAARILGYTEKGYLSFERFPYTGTLKTYASDELIPNSACTATALFCGAKTNLDTGGVDQTVRINDCEASLKKEARLPSIIDWAQDGGKATGFVTTMRVTHATPLPLYGHSANREWECEKMLPPNSRCKDIARQLIEDLPGKNINVIMGGGRQCLVSNVKGSENDPIDTSHCYRKDGRNLIEDWKTDKISKNVTYSYVSNNEELSQIDLNTEYVLGIFANSHLKFDYQRDKGLKGMPSLSKMTEKAIEVLKKKNRGFLLMIEGGLIDSGNHQGQAKKSLLETIELSNAVQKAVEITADVTSETLIIVTADHGHSLMFVGRSKRKESILGIADRNLQNGPNYTTLLYATGKQNNYQYTCKNGSVVRRDPALNDTTSYDYYQQTGILSRVVHSGVDVVIYATGPMSYLFSSVHEQTYVAHAIAFAAKIGPFKQNYSVKLELQPILIVLILLIYYKI